MHIGRGAHKKKEPLIPLPALLRQPFQIQHLPNRTPPQRQQIFMKMVICNQSFQSVSPHIEKYRKSVMVKTPPSCVSHASKLGESPATAAKYPSCNQSSTRSSCATPAHRCASSLPSTCGLNAPCARSSADLPLYASTKPLRMKRRSPSLTSPPCAAGRMSTPWSLPHWYSSSYEIG